MSMPDEDAHGKYHRFIGHFVTQFAELEFHLRRVLRSQTGMSVEVYRIIVGFPRTSDLLSKIKKLVPLMPLTDTARSDIDKCFTQLDEITKIRDRIVHFGGNPLDTGEIMVRTKPTNPSKITGELYDTFDQQELWNAARDLQQIQEFILMHTKTVLPCDQGERWFQESTRWRLKVRDYYRLFGAFVCNRACAPTA